MQTGQQTVDDRVHVGAYVDADAARQLVELAQRDDRSVSSVLRIAITEHIQRAVTDEARTDGGR